MDLDVDTGYKLIAKAYKANNEDRLYQNWLANMQLHGIASMFAEQPDYPSFKEYMDKATSGPVRLLTDAEKDEIRIKSKQISQRLRGE